MRRLIVGLFAVATAAASQAAPRPTADGSVQSILQVMHQNFPSEHDALVRSLAGQPRDATARLVYEAMERFQKAHWRAILAAPPRTLLALEARQALMLRAIEKRDVRLCAIMGDAGFFIAAIREASPAPGLDSYASALIRAAKEGEGKTPPQPATKEDFIAWLAEAERREPSVPIKRMLSDRNFRAQSPSKDLCAGAAAMHEAVAALDLGRGQRMAALLLQNVGIKQTTP